MRFGLLALGLDLLAYVVVFALGLGKCGVLRIALLLEFGSIIGMALAQFFKTAAEELEGLGDLGNEVVGVFVVFAGAGLEGGKLSGPCGQGSATLSQGDQHWVDTSTHGGLGIPLKRTRCHGRSFSYTELCRPLVLLLKVLLGKCHKLCAIFLLYGGTLSVELLYFV
ncbi:hypothetical protein HG531_014093 [Fusarium graminearum]|nr:hypothetical protein HG531_014093 [Fusarium graminearum]